MDVLAIFIERLQEMVAGFVRTLPQMAIALLVITATWAAAMLVRGGVARLARRTKLRKSLTQLLVTLGGVLVWIVGILVALAILLPGVNAGTLFAVLGLGSVALGFAFKDIFENFLAGVLIMARRKMRMGDLVECEGVEGRVELITLRETYLRRLDNQLTIVPNSFLFQNPVRIVTDARLRRHEIVVGVDYATDLDRAAEIITAAVRSAEGVEPSRPVEVFAREFNDSSIDFTVRWWSGSKALEMHQSRDSVVRGVKRALDSAGIVIPFPQVTASFLDPLRVEQADVEPGRSKSDMGRGRER